MSHLSTKFSTILFTKANQLRNCGISISIFLPEPLPLSCLVFFLLSKSCIWVWSMRRLSQKTFSVFIFFPCCLRNSPCTFRGNSVDYIKFSYFSFIVSQAMKKEKKMTWNYEWTWWRQRMWWTFERKTIKKNNMHTCITTRLVYWTVDIY